MFCKIKRTIQLNEPIQHGSIDIFLNDINITKNCNFSWSIDAVCWTSWSSYEQYNIICKNIESDFFLKILITGEFTDVIYNNKNIMCYSVSLYTENPFLINFCDTPNLFNPYANLDCALLLQQQLSDSIICMLGIPIYYFKVSPNKSTIDYTFKEYVMHHVESVKIIKLMLNDGSLPSANPQMKEFDFDWENDWEVELSKTQFATAFGDNAFPKERDFIYVPLMKRMWSVNSAYDEKSEGLLWRSTTWKLGLTKYNDNDTIISDDFDNIIDTMIVNKYEDIFNFEELEQERETGIIQVEEPKFASINMINLINSDAIRKSIPLEEKNNIISKQLNHRSVVVSRNAYKFTNPTSIIEYQQKYCGESGTISFIITTPEFFTDNNTINIIKIKNIDIKIEYIDSNSSNIIFNDIKTPIVINKSYMIICRWSRDTFTTEMGVYEHKIDVRAPKYMIKPEMLYFDFEVDDKISIYNNKYIIDKPSNVILTPYVLEISNIKIFNKYLSKDIAIKESLKYTTTNEQCIINDIARPVIIDNNLGKCGYIVQ